MLHILDIFLASLVFLSLGFSMVLYQVTWVLIGRGLPTTSAYSRGVRDSLMLHAKTLDTHSQLTRAFWNYGAYAIFALICIFFDLRWASLALICTIAFGAITQLPVFNLTYRARRLLPELQSK